MNEQVASKNAYIYIYNVSKVLIISSHVLMNKHR